jgi:hypothetical protein
MKQEKPITEKISNNSPTASILASSLKTKQIGGIPFYMIDLGVLVGFFLGAILAVSFPFRVFCVVMMAWFAFGYIRDKRDYDKLKTKKD